MMTITIDNPQLARALEDQADGLGVDADSLAASALAEHLGLQQLVHEFTGNISQMDLPMEYPVMPAIPRTA